MTRPALERQAIKQKAGQRMVAVERRSIAAREGISHSPYGCSDLASKMPLEEITSEVGFRPRLADEISKMLRPRPIRFPRELFEGAGR